MTKHTPGPWTVEGDVYGTKFIRASDGKTVSPMRSDADAYMMAAAPDMYEALESVPMPDGSMSWNEWKMAFLEWHEKAARAALLKAKRTKHMTDNDGGSAFARPMSHDGEGPRAEAFPVQGGMSLRDYFAAAALTGFGIGAVQDEYFERAGVAAYALADAMLKAKGEA